jgi:hypothetical protein
MSEWRLQDISIGFKKGHDFEKVERKKHDRYEGKISFKNSENESFCFNVPEKFTQKYIDIMAEDIVKCATELGVKLSKSLEANNVL